MRTYRRIETLEPHIVEFLQQHADRLSEVPSGMWVCEEDGRVLIVLLVYPEPRLRVSVIVDTPEKRPFASLTRIAQTFEAWAAEHKVDHYFVVIPRENDWYRRIIEKRGGVIVAENSAWIEYRHDIDQAIDKSDGIRPWRPRDWKLLRRPMRDFLTEQANAGADFLPTRNNVEAFIRRGVQAAGAGDPCFVAYADEQLVGFTLWTGLDPQGLDVRERVCSAIATYVVPDRRRQGIGRRLVVTASALARERQYGRIEAALGTRASHVFATTQGGITAGLVVRLPIPEAA